MTDDQFDVPARLASLLLSWAALSSEARLAQAGRVIEAEIRGIGEAAAFFGGWTAMEELDRAVTEAGAPNNYLGSMWDGIGIWVS